MINPQFPYKNNQIILSSDRITLHSKSEAVLLFGKQMIALATNGTINMDAKEKILIDSDKIELGHDAELSGEPVILGNKLMRFLDELVSTINVVGSELSRVSKTGDAESWMIIKECGIDLKNMGDRLIGILYDAEGPGFLLSKNTYTR